MIGRPSWSHDWGLSIDYSMPPLVASSEFLYLHSWSSWYPSCFPNRHVEASCYKCHLKKSSLPYTCILSIQESCRNFSTHLWLLWVALGQLHKLEALDPFLGCQVLARMNSCKNIGGFQWMWMTVFRVRGSFIDMEAGGKFLPIRIFLSPLLSWDFKARVYFG